MSACCPWVTYKLHLVYSALVLTDQEINCWWDGSYWVSIATNGKETQEIGTGTQGQWETHDSDTYLIPTLCTESIKLKVQEREHKILLPWKQYVDLDDIIGHHWQISLLHLNNIKNHFLNFQIIFENFKKSNWSPISNYAFIKIYNEKDIFFIKNESWTLDCLH